MSTIAPAPAPDRSTAYNTTTTLNFSGPYVEATLVRNVRDFAVDGTAIVVNTGVTGIPVGESPRKGIPALSSTILSNTRIERADSIVLLRTDLDAPIDGIVRDPGWRLLGDLLDGFPRETPLWKSPQDNAAGTISFDPVHVLQEEAQEPGRERQFQIKLNLWFAPAGTDCHIHNLHDFIEVHTQVHGLGRMQKFTAQDHATRYEDLRMSPGYTTPDPFCTTRPDGSFHYPWHQYYADTDCVWLAVEYHALTD